MEYLVIDGYNVINAWGDVFDLQKEPLEDCRDKFLHMLSNYQGYININVIVVFDAHMVKGNRGTKENFDNLSIVYTKENETADNYIERFVYKHGAHSRVRVVTSDYLEQTIVMSKGGIRVSPRELREEVNVTVGDKKVARYKDSGRTNTLMSNIKPELFEKLEKMRRDKS